MREPRNNSITFSVVVPVYNSERTLEDMALRLERVFERIGESYEIVFVDDNSKDQSWEVLRLLRDGNRNIRCFQLMRNYGQQNATMCGLSHSQGKFIITIDDDLQHPPEEIPGLISEIRKGYDVVFGICRHKQHYWLRRMGSWIVNRFYALIFRTKGNVSAFRIMRSHMAARILEYKLNFTYINGLISWYTDRISWISIPHQIRARGKSGYTVKSLLSLSVNLMTNFSLLPLQIASIAGLLFASIGFGMGAYFVIKKLFFGTPVSGFTSIIASISFFSGMILLFLGIIGEYLGRIHMNISKKPQYSIREEDEKKPKS